MKKVIRRHTVSFQYAFEGIIWAFKNQPNFRIHAFFSMCAIFGGLYFNITQIEMMVIIFTIVLGFVVEMVNTAIESMTDLITTEWKKEAKIAKDVAAGMMLLTAIGAVLIALVIFVPYIV